MIERARTLFRTIVRVAGDLVALMSLTKRSRAQLAAENPAVRTDILHFQGRALVASADAVMSAGTAANMLRGVERRPPAVDDYPRDDYGTPSTALRPPASGSRPTHGRGHHRHESRRPA